MQLITIKIIIKGVIMGIAVGAVCYIFNKIERKRKGIRYALIPGVLAFLLWVIIKVVENLIKLYM